MKQCLLDTDVLMPLFKRMPSVVEKARQHHSEYGLLNVSIVTYYEVMKGHEFTRSRDRQNAFGDFCNLNRVLPLDQAACQVAAKIYADLRRRGDLIPDADILIAGIALANNLTLVTQNLKHFQRITGLQVENWVNL